MTPCDGELAFQTVFHFHLHVIPRYAGDGWNLKGVASLLTPPGGCLEGTWSRAIRGDHPRFA